MKKNKIRPLSRKKDKCPYKPPRPPRCLCRTFKHWLLGIVSPSLFLISTDEKAVKYRRKLNIYNRKCRVWYNTQARKKAPKRYGKEIIYSFIDELHEVKE